MRIFLYIVLFFSSVFADSIYKLTGYKSNYLMPYTYDFVDKDDGRQQNEAKFQISFKRPFATDLFGNNTSIYFAYSQVSWWQVWDGDNSRPFRESNYNPEIFIQIPHKEHTFIRWWRAGYEHESNGESVAKSNSWDRAYAAVGSKYENLTFSYKLWWRFIERSKKDESDPKGDDNPDIHRYYGFSELKANWLNGKNEVAFVGRRGTRHGSFEISYNREIPKEIYLYIQYFNGYGESLIDYNQRVNKIGFGIMFERGE